MGGLDFKSEAPREREEEGIIRTNMRISLFLFSLYVLFYGTFMYLSAFHPEIVEKPLFRGVNFAIIYGIALIAAAIILALVYAFWSKKPGIGGSK
jgi:uncharacterized membrane protein (DUF485 family)